MELALAIFVIISICEFIAIIFLKKDKNEKEKDYYLAKYSKEEYGRECFEAGRKAGTKQVKYTNLIDSGYAFEAGYEAGRKDTKL